MELPPEVVERGRVLLAEYRQSRDAFDAWCYEQASSHTLREIADGLGCSAPTVMRSVQREEKRSGLVLQRVTPRAAAAQEREAKPTPENVVPIRPPSDARFERKVETVRELAGSLAGWRFDFASLTSDERWEAIRALAAVIGNAETLIGLLDTTGELEITKHSHDYRRGIENAT